MNESLNLILGAFLILNLLLVSSSRLMHCIKLVAAQGILLGLMPLTLPHSPDSNAWEYLLVMFLNIIIKGVLMPALLSYTMRKTDVRRELEPLVGYSLSLLIILGLTGIAFWIGSLLPPEPHGASVLAVPTALSTICTGLFLIITRRKAITQVIGFLVFENGVSIFGTGMMIHNGLLVELGLLLDVFALVFIMGIAVFNINRSFQHIDTHSLNALGD
ncbi:MAG: hydrogenase [Lentisphaerae bacterium]|nr:hydrogenase [Lentisphaerota bacterium]OQC12305.1 MAG: hydrogenase 4 membrane subunit [Lentisphaerae bacterium ADurb.Bin082]HQL86305.1 hydrogenase [Lentisphaeria bacterium]